MAIFYTLPPNPIPYPFILINANNPENGIRYIINNLRYLRVKASSDAVMVLIDGGVEIFRDPRIKDYPCGAEEWIRHLVRLYRRVRALLGDNAVIHVTCPDYPDDYHPKSLWLSDDYTNVERTVDNVLRCVDSYPDVPWLIPIQGWNRDVRGLLRCLELLERHDVVYKFDYFAIANLCVEPSVDIIHRSVLTVYHWFAQKRRDRMPKLHVFGLKILALRKVKRYIYSFDSTAWTRPCNKRLHDKHPYSAKNEAQRCLFFCEYIKQLSNRYGVYIPQETIEVCKKIGYW